MDLAGSHGTTTESDSGNDQRLVDPVNDGTRHPDGQYPIMGKTDASPTGRGGKSSMSNLSHMKNDHQIF